MDQDKLEIPITSFEIPAKELKAKLQEYWLDTTDAPTLELRKAPSRFRSSDPTVLVAIIAGSSAIVNVLITGLLAILQHSKNRRIVVQTPEGIRIEIPEGFPLEKIDEIIERLKELEKPHLYLE